MRPVVPPSDQGTVGPGWCSEASIAEPSGHPGEAVGDKRAGDSDVEA